MDAQDPLNLIKEINLDLKQIEEEKKSNDNKTPTAGNKSLASESISGESKESQKSSEKPAFLKKKEKIQDKSIQDVYGIYQVKERQF